MYITMKMKALLLAGGLLALTGCSNTVRMVTATQWISTTPAAPAAGGGAAPSAEIPAGGAAAAPAAASSAPSTYVLYVAYWEGSCSRSPFSSGCNRGDSKIKRCNVSADNTMVCKEETDANRALAAETK